MVKLFVLISQVEEESVPLPKKPRQEQPSSTPPVTVVTKTADSADSSYISTTKSKRKKSKRRSGQTSSKTTTATTSSGLPLDFFDSGVSKTFRGHGEEVYYESSSDSDDEQSEETNDRRQVAPPPPGLPSGVFVGPDKCTCSLLTKFVSFICPLYMYMYIAHPCVCVHV